MFRQIENFNYKCEKICLNVLKYELFKNEIFDFITF